MLKKKKEISLCTEVRSDELDYTMYRAHARRTRASVSEAHAPCKKKKSVYSHLRSDRLNSTMYRAQARRTYASMDEAHAPDKKKKGEPPSDADGPCAKGMKTGA